MMELEPLTVCYYCFFFNCYAAILPLLTFDISTDAKMSLHSEGFQVDIKGAV